MQISKQKYITRDKAGLFIMIKGVINQEDIIILHSYVSNNKASMYMKQKLTELPKEIDKSTIIVTDFNTPLSIID